MIKLASILGNDNVIIQETAKMCVENMKKRAKKASDSTAIPNSKRLALRTSLSSSVSPNNLNPQLDNTTPQQQRQQRDDSSDSEDELNE